MRDVANSRDVLVGRGEHLQTLTDRLSRAVDGRAQLVLVEGAAGVGKTALIEAFLDTAVDTPVAFARGEVSSRLAAFTVVAQLIRSAGGPSGDIRADSEPAVVGAMLLEQLNVGRRGGPLIAVIDDGQWLDGGSISALSFALRRLRSDPLLVVLAYVPEEADADALDRLCRGVEAQRIHVGELSSTEVLELTRLVGDGPMNPKAAERLRRHTGGSPLYVRALLDELGTDRIEDLDTPLPAPRSYRSFITGRLDGFSEATRRLLAAVSVLGEHCTLSDALALGEVPLATIDTAASTDLLQVDGDGPAATCHFGTELARTVVYDGLTCTERAELHARAATIVTSRGSVLRHRALATSGPDDGLADALAEHADALVERGELAAAATALVSAARLRSQPTGNDLLACVELAVESDDLGLLDTIRHKLDALPPSARVSFALGTVEFATGNLEAAEAHLAAAWSEVAATEPGLGGRIAERLCQICGLDLRIDEAIVWGARARSAVGHASDWYLTALAMSGDPLLETLTDHTVWSLDATVARGVQLLWTDDAAGARAELSAAVAGLHQAGRFQSGLRAVGYLALAEHRIGAWDDAVVHAEEAAALAEDADQVWLAAGLHCVAAMASAARGDGARTRMHLAAALAAAEVTDHAFDRIGVTVARAAVAGIAGDDTTVVDLLLPLTGRLGAEQRCAPGRSAWRITLATSLNRLGRRDEADRVLAPYEAGAFGLRRPFAQSEACLVRAAMAAAAGQPKRAEQAFRAAIDHARAADSQLQLGRARAEYGGFLVTTGRHYAAVSELQAGRALLERIGSVPDVRRCDEHLAQCGVGSLNDPRPAGRLAPRELAVARLMLDGRSDTEVAAELMISTDSVQTHVDSVLSKLGVGRREDVAHRLA